MEYRRIESKEEVEEYLRKMKCGLKNGAKINFQINRRVDDERNVIYTNKYTIADLFPDESPNEALRHELETLTPLEYQSTVKDVRFLNRSELRIFGRTYELGKDVYIKIRVEITDSPVLGNFFVFVMSFHFAEIPFKITDFPYRT